MNKTQWDKRLVSRLILRLLITYVLKTGSTPMPPLRPNVMLPVGDALLGTQTATSLEKDERHSLGSAVYPRACGLKQLIS